MAAGTTQPTNEKLVERLRAAGESTPEAAQIMEKLWEKNTGLVRMTVHKLTGLNQQEPGFEDMEQQAYFGFHAAAYAYTPEAGVQFSTYATRRIKWELCRYYERNGYTIRIPAYIKKRLRDCMMKKQELEADTGRPVDYETALKALCLSPAAIAGTLAAFNKLETASLDELHGGSDRDGISLLDMLAAGEDVEEAALSQEWHRELYELLFAALQDIDADTRAVIVQHYFSGQPFERLARERGITPQTLYNRRSAAFQSIRAGKYAAALAEYMPSTSSKARAERQIKADREAVERLQLTEADKEAFGSMTVYEMGKYWLTDALENYRDTPPEAWKRAYIDGLINGSRRAAGRSETEKKRHNLIIPRYITDTRPSKLKICKALHVGRQTYETETAHAIDRLLVLAFGLNGIDWNGEAQAGDTDETP